VLRALNRHEGEPYSKWDLARLSAKVGSDVPFCVLGGTALATGRGEKLEQLLSQVDGAGRVQVLLSLQSGMHHTYQQDMQSNTEDETVQMQSQTVLCREGSDECPVLIGTDYPVYRGAVVICEGADRAKVQLDIIRAVSSLTGLGTDRITVIKMQT